MLNTELSYHIPIPLIILGSYKHKHISFKFRKGTVKSDTLGLCIFEQHLARPRIKVDETVGRVPLKVSFLTIKKN